MQLPKYQRGYKPNSGDDEQGYFLLPNQHQQSHSDLLIEFIDESS